MSFQAYIDNIRAKTGKSPEDFMKLAAERRLTKHGEIVSWLKSNFALGHGHATAMAGADRCRSAVLAEECLQRYIVSVLSGPSRSRPALKSKVPWRHS